MRKQIPILRGLAILGVALNHCAGWGHVVMFWWAHRFRQVESPSFDQFGSLPYHVLLILRQLAWFSVPAFLFISGFSIAFAVVNRPTKAGYRLVWARIKIILWPYLIWSLALFLGDFLQGERFSLVEYIKRLVLGGAAPTYFFIPMLIQFYALSPLIVRWAKAKPGLVLLASAGVQATMFCLSAGRFRAFVYAWQMGSWALYFTMGTVCFLHYKRAWQWLIRFKWSLFAATVVLLALSVFEESGRLESSMLLAPGEPVFQRFWAKLYALTFVLCFLAFDNLRLPFTRMLQWLGERSYAIYLLHYTVMVCVARIIYHVAPRLLAHQILLQPLLLTTCIGLPVLFMAGVAKSPTKRWYRVLFGTTRHAPLRRRAASDPLKKVALSRKLSDHGVPPLSGAATTPERGD